uniref:UPF0496 protein At4g34320 family n=1 Tax=Cajanus cajan TaxID=3821 RepID=A0A151QXJ4_CAJCA|nr:UPF0496 protein At4g34320 family [Cajanus cajan]KYP66052.1 UPF0496 protein At4g34320 family [Cajanus cajan]
MGSHMSKKIPETSSSIGFGTELHYKTELSSYEAACKLDSDLQSFDTTLQARTNQVINTLAVAIAAPPVAAAIAAATSIPIGSMGKWIDSLWRNYENALKGQKEVISSMQAGTYVAIKDLDNIRVLVDRLEIEIESLLHNVDFAIEEQAVKVAIEEIKKRLGVFMKNVEDLGVQADICSRDIRRARTVVLQRIIKHPQN